MKKTTRTLSIVLLAASLGLGSKMGDAATYDDAANITTEGKVKILKLTLQTQSFLTRRIQEMRLLPKNQPILIRDFLRINYVSNFDFGQIQNVSRAIEQKRGSIMCG